MKKVSFAAFIMLSICTAGPAAEGDDLGLRVAPEFRVTVFSEPALANDIYAMTLDGQGRVVVSSRGWVKVLHAGKDGKAERATVFTPTPKGGMGLCFDGRDLLFTGDDWFSRYRAAADRDEAAGPPERISPMAFTEHGGHSARQGPDGWWYVIGGNDTGFTRERHVTGPRSLVRVPVAGALLRFSPDFKQSEVVAHGWRNPYRFDFNALGDLFTYDSDTERDLFLPWYSPTRLYHVAPGGHHGWQLSGYMRSWCRRDYYLDTVDILAPIGRGSPTGVVCYRHEQFPERYRGGLFIQDWTFGKVWFCPLDPNGTSYRSKPEVFLESVGTSGFNPTDAAVAPDGSLLVSIGGRGTRGAIYRVEYVGDDRPSTRVKPANDLDAVLAAPQPLDAWSRQQWMPLARKLGPQPFAEAVMDEKRPVAARIRAVEVLTELFGGLSPTAARGGARAESPLVKARVAWSLGRAAGPDTGKTLLQLAEDADGRVRCFALTALTERLADLDGDAVEAVLPSNLGHADKRVIQAAALLASRLPDASWKKLTADLERASVSARLSGALATLWRSTEADATGRAIATVLAGLRETTDTGLRLRAVRLLVLALGDYRLKDPAAEIYSGYSLPGSLQGQEKSVAAIRAAVRPMFPSGDERLDLESSRLLAMLEDDDPSLVAKVAAFWTPKSTATADLHYLIVLARLRGPWADDMAAHVATVLLGLHRKLQGQEQRDKQNWNTRLVELTKDLIQRDPRFGDVLLRHADLVRGAHVALVDCLSPAQKREAGRRFFDAARKDPGFDWTGPLINLWKDIPPAEVRPLLRARWENFGLRDAIALNLANGPEAIDRPRFLDALDSAQPAVLEACLAALQALPRDETAENLVPVLALLRRLQQEPKLGDLRRKTLELLNRQTGQRFAAETGRTELERLRQAYQPVYDWFQSQHPALMAKLNNADGEDPAFWQDMLSRVNWPAGDALKGEKVYRERACMTCHSGTSRIGPDLTGVAGRFARADLFNAILFPNRDVAPAYRVETIETRAGKSYTGITVFYSADGVILQTDAATTLRIASADIESRQPSSRSLMPTRLLKDLKPDDLADLYSYLQTLTGPK